MLLFGSWLMRTGVDVTCGLTTLTHAMYGFVALVVRNAFKGGGTMTFLQFWGSLCSLERQWANTSFLYHACVCVAATLSLCGRAYDPKPVKPQKLDVNFKSGPSGWVGTHPESVETVSFLADNGIILHI